MLRRKSGVLSTLLLGYYYCQKHSPSPLTNPNPYYHPSKLNTNSTFCEVASPCILSHSLPLSLNTVICFHSYFSKLIGRSLGQKTCYCHRLVGWLLFFYFQKLLTVSVTMLTKDVHPVNMYLNQWTILTKKKTTYLL